jgi:hypothetical protein
VSGITGIELGPDACVLVRTGRRGLRTTVAGARAIARTEWSEDREGLTGALRKARQAHSMPTRARVVAWETSTSQLDLDVAELSQLNPVLMAGFEIEAILSPAEALADLVRARPIDTTSSAVAAVSMNARGAAIAIVSKGELISSRTFNWPLGPPLRLRAELLERYLLVAQLAPQLQHLIELVRPVYGACVSSVLVSGTVPSLRSLSMLLIEELDIEVETLDSVDLLEPNLSFLVEAVAGLQLAAAAATEPVAGIVAGKVPATFPDNVTAAYERRVSGRGTSTLSALAFALVAAWSYLQLSGVARAVPLFSPRDAQVLAAAKADADALSAPAVPDLRIEATMGRIGEPVDLPAAPDRRALPAPRAGGLGSATPAAGFAAAAPGGRHHDFGYPQPGDRGRPRCRARRSSWAAIRRTNRARRRCPARPLGPRGPRGDQDAKPALERPAAP